MPEPAITPDAPVHPTEHPALRAWLELRAGGVEPERAAIRTVRCKPKSTVYQLVGVGPGGSAVIAKHCLRATARIEHAVYVEVLQRLPLTALRCYGLVEEGNGPWCWLFLEDAGEERYSPECADQRALAGRWLGTLHTSAAHVGATVRLPDRGPGYYLEHLRSARDTVRRNGTNPELATEDREVLARVLSSCDLLEARWGEVQRSCEDMPRTLVHGDCVVKNVRVRSSPAGLALRGLLVGRTGVLAAPEGPGPTPVGRLGKGLPTAGDDELGQRQARLPLGTQARSRAEALSRADGRGPASGRVGGLRPARRRLPPRCGDRVRWG